MKGINHIITGVSTAVIVDTSIRAVSNVFESTFYDNLCHTLCQPLVSILQTLFPHTIAMITTFFINAVMFLLGCLLPDCDQENSIMGRMLYVPVRHRTWTHTIWCVVVFSLMGIAVPCFYWLAYGYTIHLFYDSLSKGGICWLYPISGYKIWASGAQVKKNHKIYLYRTGETSETILIMLISSVGVCMLIYAIHLTILYDSLPFHAEWLFAVSRA